MMNRRWFAGGALLAFAPFGLPCLGQKKAGGHRAVFELTSGSEEVWTAVLNNVENLRKALGESTEVEVVAHGPGLNLYKKTATAFRERLQELSKRGVRFAACENTMRRQNVKKEDLFPEVTTVDSGVAEVVRKQEAGWSYVKSGS